jgi:hypothetical protein
VDSKEVVLDERRRTSLAKVGRKQDQRYLAESFDDGTIVLTPAVTISAVELAVLADPKARKALRRAADRPKPRLTSRGTFSRRVGGDGAT